MKFKEGTTFEILHGIFVSETEIAIPSDLLKDTRDYHGGFRLYGFMLAVGGRTFDDLKAYAVKFNEPLEAVISDLESLERDGWVKFYDS